MNQELAGTSINEKAAEEFYRRGIDAEKESNNEKELDFF